LRANLPETVHAHTVTSACISSLSAIDAAVNAIALGKADAIIAGGCETFSDVPLEIIFVLSFMFSLVHYVILHFH
jgi:acetyl-CoA acetyltransferase